MHSPNLITPIVASEVIGSQTAAASTYRASGRNGSTVFGRFRRRSGASRPLVPRGRTLPPLAH
jgi:hypothetical protein